VAAAVPLAVAECAFVAGCILSKTANAFATGIANDSVPSLPLFPLLLPKPTPYSLCFCASRAVRIRRVSEAAS
jgi:hypothetical protein